jgi:hypothetical protein
MPIIGLLYKALKKFLSPTPLNSDEIDQPATQEVRRAHLKQELEKLNDEPRYEAEREP